MRAAIRHWCRPTLGAVAVAANLVVMSLVDRIIDPYLLFLVAVPPLVFAVTAPSRRRGLLVGLPLAGLSVVPAVVLGRGGLSMIEVRPGAAPAVVLYLPVTILVVGVASLFGPRFRIIGGTLRVVLPLSLATVMTLCCCGFWWATEGTEIPRAPDGAILSMLPDGLRPLTDPAGGAGGSSVAVNDYDIVDTAGRSVDEIAVDLSTYVRDLTGWDLAIGYSNRCYRAYGLIRYPGRFCVAIRPSKSTSGR